MILLPQYYRFNVQNLTGQTIPVSGLTITANRYKFGTDGSLSYEGNASLFTNTGTITNTGIVTTSNIDNSTNKWLGGVFEVTTSEVATPSGSLTVFLERSTDNSTWDADLAGDIVCVVTPTASGNFSKSFQL